MPTLNRGGVCTVKHGQPLILWIVITNNTNADGRANIFTDARTENIRIPSNGADKIDYDPKVDYTITNTGAVPLDVIIRDGR